MKLGYSYTELQPWLGKYKNHGKFDKDLDSGISSNSLKGYIALETQ
jgi:hypothetical protein